MENRKKHKLSVFYKKQVDIIEINKLVLVFQEKLAVREYKCN